VIRTTGSDNDRRLIWVKSRARKARTLSLCKDEEEQERSLVRRSIETRRAWWSDESRAEKEIEMYARILAPIDGSPTSNQGAMVETLQQRVADKILNEAREWRADIIVMGTHGRRGFGHLVLGSDAEAVLHDAPVPVLLIKAVPAEDRPKASV
jgi:hypothetical protein